jgi:hypothetical protein
MDKAVESDAWDIFNDNKWIKDQTNSISVVFFTYSSNIKNDVIGSPVYVHTLIK